jgi:Protein of unknown function (DUF4058)
MPIHDWDRVDAGTFHFFHMTWIVSICGALNGGILPRNYYAMGEQRAAGDEPDVLTLHATPSGGEDGRDTTEPSEDAGGGLLLAPPRVRIIEESDTDSYRRKQNRVVIRHASDDRVVAIIEIVSRGNKSTRQALEQFVRKAAKFLDQGIHLLIVDIQSPGRHDPEGIHGAIWDYITDRAYTAPADKPLTVVAYEYDLAYRAYVEPVAVGDPLPDMPLFLRPGRWVKIPLEATYQTTWRVFPQRWKDVIDQGH